MTGKRKRDNYDSEKYGRNSGGPRGGNPAGYLRRSIAELGEPSRRKVDDVIDQLTRDLVEAPEETNPGVLEMIKAVLYEQPHKIAFLVLVLEQVNHEKPDFGFLVVEMAHDELSKALMTGDWSRFKLYLRFVCALTIVESEPIVELLTELLKRATDLAGVPLGWELYTTVAFAAVYLVHSGGTISAELSELLSNFPISEDLPAADKPFFGDEKPYDAVPSLLLLKEAVIKWKDEGFKTDFMIDTNEYIRDRKVPVKHKFPTVHVAPTSEIHPSTASRVLPLFTRIYLTNEVETVPPPNTIFAQLLRDIALDNINHMDFNRKEVTRQLITLDLFFNPAMFAQPGASLDALVDYPAEKSTWKVEDVAVEAVLSQIFRLSQSEFPLVYYSSILIEACIMAPLATAPVLGRALRFIFANATTLDAELIFRVVEWFAHHVSNFGFTWKWGEWTDSLQLPEDHPQQIFIRELLAKEVRLSYPQRVRDLLPEEFKPLVRDTPEVPYFAQEKYAGKLADALSFQKNLDESELGDLLVGDLDPRERASAIVAAVCHAGNRSISHVKRAIKAAKDLIIKNVSEDRVIVDTVYDYWKDSLWVGSLVCEQFIEAKLLSPEPAVDFVFENTGILLSSLGWETIVKYPLLAQERISRVKFDGEWGAWWHERLGKAVARRASLEPEPDYEPEEPLGNLKDSVEEPESKATEKIDDKSNEGTGERQPVDVLDSQENDDKNKEATEENNPTGNLETQENEGKSEEETDEEQPALKRRKTDNLE